MSPKIAREALASVAPGRAERGGQGGGSVPVRPAALPVPGEGQPGP
jgi:hypothetical protein